MRTIKFRGMNVNGKFIYGYPCIRINKNNVEMCDIEGVGEDGWFSQSFIKETLGQFTENKDKNGTEIFEGDIIKREWKTEGSMNDGFDLYICEWKSQRWLHAIDVPEWRDIDSERDEVIGNIYEHKHLLGDSE